MKTFMPLLLLINFHCSNSQAEIILTRPELNSQLGGNAITEDFESWSGTRLTPFDFTTLDSSTTVSGQGPGIVNSGLLFSNINSNRIKDELQLDRRAQFGIPSGALLAEGGTLVVDFTIPISQFGLDLFQFSGFADSTTVRVFASDDSTLLFTSGLLSAPAAPASTFFGYSEDSGVGRVTFQSTTVEWSPLIDNLTYGSVAAVPEPSSFLMFVVSGGFFVVRRMRRR